MSSNKPFRIAALTPSRSIGSQPHARVPTATALAGHEAWNNGRQAQSCSMSPFRSHVSHVVFWGTEEKVIGIHARRIIAVMAHKHPHWYRTIMQFPRKAMRALFSAKRFMREDAVAVAVRCTCPHPTSVSLLNMSPKADFKGNGLSGGVTPSQDVNLHRQVSFWSGSLENIHSLASRLYFTTEVYQ